MACLADFSFGKRPEPHVARAPRQFVVWCRCGSHPLALPGPAENHCHPRSSKQRRGSTLSRNNGGEFSDDAAQAAAEDAQVDSPCFT
jgi:hypothetical protein